MRNRKTDLLSLSLCLSPTSTKQTGKHARLAIVSLLGHILHRHIKPSLGAECYNL